MKLSQLSLADYNQLDSIPVINQDLSASGFTPTTNTYYRHTGATNDTFTQGVIYLYDTAYHKLGESGGGGTTLNKYTYTGSIASKSERARLYNIISNAKGNIMAVDSNSWGYSISSYPAQSIVQLNASFAASDGGYIYTLEIGSTGQLRNNRGVRIPTDGTITLINEPVTGIIIVYYNDVEIT